MLIGISGKIGSGKDTVADLIAAVQDRHGKPIEWEIRRFADRLKCTVATLTQTSVAQNYSREGKQFQPPGFHDSLGTLQQKVGMAIREHVDPNVWINIALHGAGEKKNIIVADVRFQNEAEAIRRLGGMLIRVNGDPQNCRSSDSRALEHASETELDAWSDFDWVVENNGTLEELSKKVQAWTQEIFIL
jgi:hypothetical protein